ncbi:MAG TPA: choice-of-anchor J domain-containing protein, partial [Saprospiraceae bacterium]|nr:choice-of-anchor J domain-containing protein [Saprospiraceae bacterium]
NHYAQATSFQDVAVEMESWLITPSIVLDVPKKITFESAYAFLVQNGLTIWISSDFNGTNVGTATWTQLFPTIASAANPENTFIPSGNIDLSGFTGPVRIGFKYVGSGPGGQTSTFRIDNVKVEKL